ncbi:N-formylglutamate deformylase [Sphingomonas sp. Leaf357]|uniref:N-formylglutamate deformylase n=1 Tax=Sphingomonas sp. Leaf357 TaxID=1736350 RepID=UPI0006FAB692|nr:N-formylglutamate deformylase [Sphingomonas sp. Leaf357]KQS05040.1 N-formylglutamate deformylase [Sphingomonas sp. Leaf357]
MTDWLQVSPGDAPLVVAFPHTGTDIPESIASRFRSPWLARKDADWWIDRLYDFAGALGATTVRTTISRSVIDVNRDPSGVSLYPGQATTGLCPIETFDGEPLYREGPEPSPQDIAERRAIWFDPYHAAIADELQRLRRQYDRVVLYDAHSIRSIVPRLFDGELPQFNIGTFDGAACASRLTQVVAAHAAFSGYSHVVDGRFKGGWTTRHYGEPEAGVHAIQMELACRGYMADPAGAIDEHSWPAPYDPETAAPLRTILRNILTACIDFARGSS